MTHEPKWRALIALDAGVLSRDGRRRLLAHLDGCEECSEAHASIVAFEHVASEIRGAEPQVDFAAIDAAIAEEGRRESKRLRAVQAPETRRPWLVPVAVVALAAAAAWMLWPKDVTPERVDPVADRTVVEPTQETPEPVREAAHATVVAVSGGATSDGVALAVGDVVTIDAQLAVEGPGAVHLQLADGTGFALESDSRATFEHGVVDDELGVDEVIVALASGRSEHRVESGTAYEVTAGRYAVRVRGTHFEVVRSDERVAVTLDEGIVEVWLDGELLETLAAPARWANFSNEVRDLAQERRVGAHPWSLNDHVAPVAVGDGTRAPLSLPEVDEIVRWQAAGVLLPAGVGTRLMAPLGELVVEGFEEDGTRHEATLVLAEEGGELTEADLSTLRARPGGYLAPEVISEVVRPSRRALRNCYERELRNHEDLEGTYTLHVSVARTGEVRRVRVVTRDNLPPPMETCFERLASRWVFPAPRGGALSFDLPLSLSAR